MLIYQFTTYVGTTYPQADSSDSAQLSRPELLFCNHLLFQPPYSISESEAFRGDFEPSPNGILGQFLSRARLLPDAGSPSFPRGGNQAEQRSPTFSEELQNQKQLALFRTNRTHFVAEEVLRPHSARAANGGSSGLVYLAESDKKRPRGETGRLSVCRLVHRQSDACRVQRARLVSAVEGNGLALILDRA